MRLLYKHEHDGVWFSKNGHAAYQRGEKPIFMWPQGTKLTATDAHHIARKRMRGDYSRELVMFYFSDEARILKQIGGVLRSAIHQHGPITPQFVPSAAKRVMGALSKEGGG